MRNNIYLPVILQIVNFIHDQGYYITLINYKETGMEYPKIEFKWRDGTGKVIIYHLEQEFSFFTYNKKNIILSSHTNIKRIKDLEDLIYDLPNQ